MSDHPKNLFQPNPRVIEPEDFAALADLAWRHHPRQSLAKSMHLATGVSESTCERWINGTQNPPVERVREALKLADQAMEGKADLLDRVAKLAAGHMTKAERIAAGLPANATEAKVRRIVEGKE